MKFCNSSDLEWSDENQKQWEKKNAIGKKLNFYADPVREAEWNKKLDGLRFAISPFGRMSDQELGEVKAYLDEVRDKTLRSEYFRNAEFDKTMQSLLYTLVEDLLDRHKDIKSVTNIGSYFAYVDWKLANAFPNVEFTAVDLVERMDELNSEHQAPNLSFVSGYALDLIEKSEILSDIVCFSATGAEIKNNELQNYMKILKPIVEYLVLSEPLYNLPGGNICDPLSLDKDQSIPAYIHPDTMPHRRGPISYIHNYREMLEAAGYRILHYNARKLDFSELRWVDIIAVPDDKQG